MIPDSVWGQLLAGVFFILAAGLAAIIYQRTSRDFVSKETMAASGVDAERRIVEIERRVGVLEVGQRAVELEAAETRTSLISISKALDRVETIVTQLLRGQHAAPGQGD